MSVSFKRTLSMFLVVVLVLSVTVNCFYNVAGVTSQNLLQNGDFENFSGTTFDNWTLWPGNHGNSTINQVDGLTNKSAKISVNDNSSIANLYQNITLETDSEYIFSVWIKTENIVRQWETAPGVHLDLWADHNVKISSQAVNIDGDWQKLEVLIDGDLLQGDEEDVRFDIAIEYVKGDIYVDDACLVKKEEALPPPTGEPDLDEMLKNNGFETYSGGVFENWDIWRGNNGNTTLEQVDGRTGKAAKVTVDNNNNTVNLYQVITLESDKEYVLSAWVKTENIALQWEGANGVYLTLSYNNNQSLVKSEFIKTDSDWQKLEFEVSASQLTGEEWAVNFDIAAEYLTGSIYVDDVSLKVKETTPEPDPTPDPEPEPTPDPEPTPNPDEENDDALLKNNGFENYSNGTFKNWDIWRGNNGNTTLEQVDGRTGKAAKVTVDNNNNTVNLYQVITLESDKEYVLSAWVKTENIALQWEGANGVYLTLSYNNNQSLVKSEFIKTDSDWQKLEIIVAGSQLTGEEWAVNFDIAAEYLTGSIYVDDVSLKVKETTPDPEPNPEPTPDPEPTPTPTPEEEKTVGSIKNGGFETYKDGKFDSWDLWKGNHGNTTLEQVDGRTGKAAKITVDNNNNTINLYQTIKLDPKKKYLFTVWVKTQDIALQFEGAQGVYLKLSYNNNLTLVKSISVTTDSDWQKLEIVVKGDVLKGDEWAVNFDIAAEYLTGTIYVDDATITEADETSEETPIVEDDDTDKNTDGGSDNEIGEELKNDSFEYFKDGGFKNWTFWKGNKGNAKLEQAVGRTGKAAKITVDNDQNIVRLYQEVKLDPTKEYTFSVWIKTENVKLQWDGAQGVYVNLACDNSKILMSESVNKNSDWKKLEVVVNGAVLNGDEWSVCFDIAMEYMTGVIYIDDANIEVTGKATPIPKADKDELLKNNSFEIYSAGNFANWTSWKGNKGNTKIEQVDGRNGKAAKITVDNNNNIVNLYQETQLDPTKEYTFSVWIKTDNIALQWAGAQGVYLNFKYNNTVILMSKPVTVDSDWQKLELVVNGGILQGDEWGVSIDIAAEFLTGTIYIDDASVKATGKGTPVPKEAADELLKNSSFELYSGYNFARWNLNRGNNGNTLLEQVNKGRTGKGAKITVDDNNNIVSLYQNITLDPKYEYTFTVWVKLQDIKLQWEGAEGVYLGFGYNNTTPIKSKAIKTDTDNWQKLEVVVGGGDLKGDEWGVMFTITAEFLTGTILIDDASMKVTGKYQPKATTFLTNGSFDLSDDDTVIQGWNAFAEDIFSVLERNTNKTKDGIASASIFNSDDKVVSFWEQRLDKLDVTKQYLLSGYVFSDMIVSENYGAAVFVEFYDREGHLIRTERSDYVTGEQTDWTEFQLKLAFPENCFTMVIKAALIKAVGTAYFDGFSLTEFEETNFTTKEGVFENIYFMGITEETDSVEVEENNSKLPTIFLIAIIVGSVVLLGTGVTLFIVLTKRKKAKKYEQI